MKVSVSILNEYDRLVNAVKKVNDSSSDYLHVDVMDGNFTSNKKFPYEVVSDIKLLSNKKLDIHMMVNDYNMIKKYCDFKPEYLTIHVEVIKDNELLDYIRKKGIKVGLAINPETDINELIPYLQYIDLILFMSVKPGLPGQNFKEEVIDKIKEVKKIIPKNIIISIDGGINNKTIELCKYAGCDMVVSGSFITNKESYDQAVKELR